MIFNISPRSSISLFTDVKSAGLLSSSLELNNALPDNADFDLTTFGVGYLFKNLNSSNLFSGGVSIEIELSAGNKLINRNPIYSDDIYENLDLKSAFYHLEGTGVYQLLLGRNWQFYQRFKTGFLFNGTLFSNDLFRLGGFGSLRGFNENFFFASDFLMSNSELRLFFEESSYLFAFVDEAWMQFRVDGNTKQQYPLGFRFGLQLGTRSGDFTMSYALGKSSQSPIDFGQSKIHFGLISRF